MNVKDGVPQDSVLRPLLFLISLYVNDVEENIFLC